MIIKPTTTKPIELEFKRLRLHQDENHIGEARKLGGGGGGEGVLSLNTCAGGMMFWQRGPTFTFLTGDTVSVTTSSHQRNAIEFAGKPMMAQH